MRSKSQKSSFRNLKLTLEYDGAKFFGFQRQKNRPTIQAALETALSKLFNRKMKISAAAGRTDSGVHATGQVVNFKTDSRFPPGKIQKGLNALLPREVAVKEIEEVPTDFHARYGARSKTYEYRVLNSGVRSPILNGRVYQFPYLLDLRRMKKAARRLVGRHDFKAFQASGSSAKTSIRCIHRLSIRQKGPLVIFEVKADGFLYHMVRNIVGTLLEIGRGRHPAKGSRGPTAPAYGLTLTEVLYGR
ncbi:MAG: tRNA pseudouridine(38-40) synthase TruA [Candidatus Omnitrophica bacterium]|nr:tRNA pseudouridine(38-40) synthase TruA [Candidatus Omnitrophota bacterium]